MNISSLSIALGIICLLLIKKTRLSALLFIIVSLVSTVWILYLTANHFSKDGLSIAVLMHIKSVFNIHTVKLFYLELMLFIFTVSVTIYLLYKCYSAEHKFTSQLSTPISISFTLYCLGMVIFSFSTSPIALDVRSIYQQYSINQKNLIDKSLFNVEFLTPPITYSTPSNKRNFVIIFAESLESAFLDNSLFPNLTPRLQETLKRHNPLYIDNINDLVMSNWTFGGMSAALCGISYSPNYSLGKPHLLTNPKIVGESCIGDALKKDGYSLSFVAGSDFGIDHKKKLLSNQGVQNFQTKEEIQTYFSNDLAESKWGIYDDDLLKFSLSRIKKLSSSNEPFGEIVLTVDTHVPGLKTPSCHDLQYGNGKSSILNSVHCADKLLSDYINNIYTLPNSDNITVILLSDHLHPGSEPTIDSLERINRKNLFVSLNSPATNINNSNHVKASQLDIAPTILHLLGYSIDSFNLGRNVFNSEPSLPKQTLVETLSHKLLNANIVPIRHKINSFWQSNN